MRRIRRPLPDIRDKLGIASVATTHTTDSLTAQALAGAESSASRALLNPDIEAMTRRALRLVLDDYAHFSGRKGPGSVRSPGTSISS
ncbi:hypothetical protein [Streptomyces sp. NPDC020965]|uniref:hypothetical protein n=1 Tax=Streptomyces sp. NPDC020965 TaxID=3365105 RepID=UPI0037A1479B